MEPGYKEYLVKGVVVQAKKSPGGKFYFIILPGGDRLVHLALIFEQMAKLVEEPHGHCAK